MHPAEPLQQHQLRNAAVSLRLSPEYRWRRGATRGFYGSESRGLCGGVPTLYPALVRHGNFQYESTLDWH